MSCPLPLISAESSSLVHSVTVGVSPFQTALLRGLHIIVVKELFRFLLGD